MATAFNTMASDLSARAEALAASDRVRRQLLADVSHELTTPVTAMRGYLETLTMPELTLDEATRARYLTIISDETQRLERLIGDLLELARLEGGGGALRFEPVPVAESVRPRGGAARTARASALASRCPGSIAPDAGDRCRRSRPAGAGAPESGGERHRGTHRQGRRVRLASRAVEAGVALSVEDSGVAGITEEHLPHVFDRFYKAEASRPFERTKGSQGEAEASAA